MPESPSHLLVINAGSSSVKFAVYAIGAALEWTLHGEIARIGLGRVELNFVDADGDGGRGRLLDAHDHSTVATWLLDWLQERIDFTSIAAIGHRIVHGMQRSAPARVTQELLDELGRVCPCAPEHLPHEIALIEAFRERLPGLTQVVCFDTAFHRTMPRVATLLAIPRRFDARGVQRYGFHGLSYECLMDALVRLGDPAASNGRVILAHLGNGASLAAIRDGASIDTTMGFTPASGVPMGTRAGDLDPGLVDYLARTEGMTPSRFNEMVTQESGLLGVSETSADMRDLLARETDDVRAAEAVALFCYQVKKSIGAFAAALGGLDTLVFSGGIGENAPPLRARICEGLGFLGIELDAALNAASSERISSPRGRVTVRVLHTDEALMIARTLQQSGLVGAASWAGAIP